MARGSLEALPDYRARILDGAIAQLPSLRDFNREGRIILKAIREPWEHGFLSTFPDGDIPLRVAGAIILFFGGRKAIARPVIEDVAYRKNDPLGSMHEELSEELLRLGVDADTSDWFGYVFEFDHPVDKRFGFIVNEPKNVSDHQKISAANLTQPGCVLSDHRLYVVTSDLGLAQIQDGKYVCNS